MKWLAVAVFLVLVASGLSDAQYPTGAADRPVAGAKVVVIAAPEPLAALKKLESTMHRVEEVTP